MNMPSKVMQSTQAMNNMNTTVNQNLLSIIGLLQGVCSILCIIGLIVGIIYMVIGIIYMVKSKKSFKNKIIIGLVIIIVPFILTGIVHLIKFNMLVNM